eukprot:364389-Chlamydomonas_euryale.AAC.6
MEQGVENGPARVSVERMEPAREWCGWSKALKTGLLEREQAGEGGRARRKQEGGKEDGPVGDDADCGPLIRRILFFWGGGHALRRESSDAGQRMTTYVQRRMEKLCATPHAVAVCRATPKCAGQHQSVQGNTKGNTKVCRATLKCAGQHQSVQGNTEVCRALPDGEAVYNTGCVQHWMCTTLDVYNTGCVQHWMCTTLDALLDALLDGQAVCNTGQTSSLH